MPRVDGALAAASLVPSWAGWGQEQPCWGAEEGGRGQGASGGQDMSHVQAGPRVWDVHGLELLKSSQGNIPTSLISPEL